MLAEIAVGSLLTLGGSPVHNPNLDHPNLPNLAPHIKTVKISDNNTVQSDDVYNGMNQYEAKIVFLESSGQPNVSNGRYYGLYQLNPAYLHGDYSISGQKKAAKEYLKSRYHGSWAEAYQFHITNGWW